MSAPAARTAEEAVEELFRAFDALDTATIMATFADDAQGVDELSGGWRRDADGLREYLTMLEGSGLSDVHSTLNDVEVRELSDTVALVTLMLDQRYVAEGEPHRIEAPTSIVMRNDGGSWRVLLVHTVPTSET